MNHSKHKLDLNLIIIKKNFYSHKKKLIELDNIYIEFNTIT